MDATACDTTVVRAEARYLGAEPHEYRDPRILRSASDGRAQHLEEWAHWPGMAGWSESQG